MEIWNLVILYVAFLLVILLHELGHLPKSIQWKWWGIFPQAAAIQAGPRLGGLIVNVILFVSVAHFAPTSILIQYMGLIAWGHFMLYAIVGSVVPEPKMSQVNLKTHIFDDVPNEYGFMFILAAIVSYILFQSYYIPILGAIL